MRRERGRGGQGEGGERGRTFAELSRLDCISRHDGCLLCGLCTSPFMFWYVVQYYYPLVYQLQQANSTHTFKIQYNSMCNVVNYPNTQMPCYTHCTTHTSKEHTHSLTVQVKQ